MSIQNKTFIKTTFAGIIFAITAASGLVAPANASPMQVIDDQVCFYKGSNFSGQSFCVTPGQRSRMPAGFARRVSSIFVAGKISATLCTGQIKRGRCRTYTQSTKRLGSMSNKSRSYQISRQPGKMVEQKAAVRTLAFTIGKTFDLDGLGRRYVVAPDPAFSDIKLKRSTRGIFYGVRLSPIHGAKLSLGQGNNRTKAQCRSARYNSGSINMTAGMAGKYVCVKTNSGHYGKMRIVGMSANTTKVRYTHW